MIKPLLDFARRHIILFGAAKFAAGLVIGFALGVYFLPILTEEKGLDTAALAQLETSAERSGTFTRDLPDSDAFHWGEVKAFSNFSLDVPPGITVGDYPAVLIWCEAFGEFITAAELN